MIAYIIAASAALFVLIGSLTAAVGQYRRHRARPAAYQVVMARYLWQPDKHRFH